MDGARDRAAEARALVWYGAMMPHLKTPPSFKDFVKPATAAPKRQSKEELQMMCEALAAAWGAKMEGEA